MSQFEADPEACRALCGVAARRDGCRNQRGGSWTPPGHQNRWVATWSSAPIEPGPNTVDALFGNDHSLSFENQTVRNIVHTSVGGQRIRVRLSNAFGHEPLRIGAAQVALRRADAAIYPAIGAPADLQRAASPSWSRPARVAVSDAVDLDVPPRAISRSASICRRRPSRRLFTKQTHADLVRDRRRQFRRAPRTCRGATATLSTFYLSAVEVQPAESIGDAGGAGRLDHAGSRVDARHEPHLAGLAVGATQSKSAAAAAWRWSTRGSAAAGCCMTSADRPAPRASTATC